MRILAFVVAVAFGTAIAASAADLPPGASPIAATPVSADHGMVVTGQRRASEIGVEILRQGGNAVDAAVAVGYALAVVLPSAGNIGGGGFMTLRLADGQARFLDFRERAPIASRATMYEGPDGKLVPGLSTDGHLAVAVPGTVLGLETARIRYGTMLRAALIAPAIFLAENGFTLEPGDAGPLQSAARGLARDPAAAAIFLKEGAAPYQAGDRLVQRDLARSLRSIAERGADAFYKGEIGAAIVASSQAGGGILQQADLDSYAVHERAPIRCRYRDYDIVSAPPPSSGGIALCETLNILEAYPLAALGRHSPQGVHLIVEALRQAYRDRNTVLGDPDFVAIPTDRLLDKGYAAEIRSRIDPVRAGVSRPLTEPAPREGTQTTHFSIVDTAGNAVAVTYTLNGSFGAKVVAAGTGILLNNEMDDFTTQPGAANLYGLVQGQSNAIAPGKTPLSSMSPTIVEKDGQPVMVTGSPGGSRIITIVLETILGAVDYGLTIQEAVDAPRIHHQWLPDTLYAEPGALAPETAADLAARGYAIETRGSWGVAEAITIGGARLGITPDAGTGRRLFGGSDRRNTVGAAIGY